MPDEKHYFICTRCCLQVEGTSRVMATCPECGDKYDHFFTGLIRCGTFALAYWLDRNPGIIIRIPQEETEA